MAPESTELTRVLALVQSTFDKMPGRNRCCAEIFSRRQQYLRSEGIVWTVGGSVENRKHGEAVLARLRDGGLITLPKRSGEHRHVGLTVRGDDVARQLVGSPTVADCWPTLLEIVDDVAHHRGVGPTGRGVWLPTPDDDAAAMTPLFIRGLVRIGIDADGCQYVTSTAEGEAASKQPAPVPQDSIERDPEAAEVYQDAYLLFLTARDKWEGPTSNVFIPFPSRRVRR